MRSTGASGSADLSRSSSVLVLSLKTDVEQVFIDTSLGYELVDLNTSMLWKRKRVNIPLLANLLGGDTSIFHVSIGLLACAFSMHYNCSSPVEEN